MKWFCLGAHTRALVQNFGFCESFQGHVIIIIIIFVSTHPSARVATKVFVFWLFGFLFFLRSSAMCQMQTCFFYLAPIWFCCWLVSLWPGPLVIFHYIKPKPLLHMLGRICVSSWIFKRVWGQKCHNQSGRKKGTPPAEKRRHQI